MCVYLCVYVCIKNSMKVIYPYADTQQRNSAIHVVLLQQSTYMSVHVYICASVCVRNSVRKRHTHAQTCCTDIPQRALITGWRRVNRIPYLYRSFSANEPYI